jgi:hypothetical protein
MRRRLIHGGYYNPSQPDPARVDIRDIAEQLAKTCRFQGQCPGWYDNASHSLLVLGLASETYVEDRDLGFSCLLHDACEVYTGFGDVCGTIKPRWLRVREKDWTACIAEKFGFRYRQVREFDKVALRIEVRDILGESLEEFGCGTDIPTSLRAVRRDPAHSYTLFMETFNYVSSL